MGNPFKRDLPPAHRRAIDYLRCLFADMRITRGLPNWLCDRTRGIVTRLEDLSFEDTQILIEELKERIREKNGDPTKFAKELRACHRRVSDSKPVSQATGAK